jgi:hypothetical protein
MGTQYGGDVRRGTTATLVVGRRHGQREAVRSARGRAARGAWRWGIGRRRWCGLWESGGRRDGSASGPSGGRGAVMHDAGAGSALWTPGCKTISA